MVQAMRKILTIPVQDQNKWLRISEFPKSVNRWKLEARMWVLFAWPIITPDLLEVLDVGFSNDLDKICFYIETWLFNKVYWIWKNVYTVAG